MTIGREMFPARKLEGVKYDYWARNISFKMLEEVKYSPNR